MAETENDGRSTRTARQWVIRQRVLRGVLVLGLVVVTLSVRDALEDFEDGESVVHLAEEGLTMTSALAAIGATWWLLVDERRYATRRAAEAAVETRRLREVAAYWQEEASQLVRDQGESITRQFGRWGLTPAEREVALLLLKGLSFKDIGGVRGTSERTVRQQARDVYRKAGLAGRAELSAWFIEDLLSGPQG